jgi:serine/threonine-protein kinase HipA
MTSEPTTAFVWIWLPDATEPVVCGRVDDDGGRISFTYARSYRDRGNAVAIYGAELPLVAGPQFAASGLRLPLCIDDALVDSWGRRLINFRLGAPTGEFSELTYLLESGSDRIGALDFQTSATEYQPRFTDHLGLHDLATAAQRIEAGEPLNAALEAALLHGTSIGGARPKALLIDAGRHLIAKLSSSTDTFPVVQGEFVAMELAHRAGLDVARVALVHAAGRYALLVERFDRDGAGHRVRMVSALTVLELTTFPEGRYATYVDLAHKIRELCMEPDATLRELFTRIAFNMLCSNTDDHGRNHAFLLSPDGLRLSPAYDICPQARTGRAAQQAMAFAANGGRASRVGDLVAAAASYHLNRVDAQAIVDHLVSVIRNEWDEVCDAAELTRSQRGAFMERQFLNPGVFD